MLPESHIHHFDAPHATAEDPTRAVVARLLQLFRASVPAAHGIVLSTSSGVPIAHDLPMGANVTAAAEAAAEERARIVARRPQGDAEEPASAFVETAAGRALVVFVESDLVLLAGLGNDPDAATGGWGGFDGGDGYREVIEA